MRSSYGAFQASVNQKKKAVLKNEQTCLQMIMINKKAWECSCGSVNGVEINGKKNRNSEMRECFAIAKLWFE